MPNYAVEYDYHPDQASLRDEHRPEHRRFLGDGHAAGTVLLAGPYSDGSGALLMIRADDERSAGEFLANDPFAAAGAIAATRITEWVNVYGPFGE